MTGDKLNKENAKSNRLLDVLNLAAEYFHKKEVSEPKLSAEILLSQCLNMKRLDLYLNFDRPLSEIELETFRGYLRRRAAHEPVQYICGVTGFRHVEILTGTGVLIPRPETEQLVDLVLERIRQRDSIPTSVLELCTGSGAISISLAVERDNLEITATDISSEALAWAEKNAAHNEKELKSNIRFISSDLFSSLSEGELFDIIVANPPYVSEEEMQALPPDVKNYEPELALAGGGENGAGIIEKIVAEAHRFMNHGAAMFLETGEKQRTQLETIMSRYDHKYSGFSIRQDMTGRDRYLIIEK